MPIATRVLSSCKFQSFSITWRFYFLLFVIDCYVSTFFHFIQLSLLKFLFHWNLIDSTLNNIFRKLFTKQMQPIIILTLLAMHTNAVARQFKYYIHSINFNRLKFILDLYKHRNCRHDTFNFLSTPIRL